MQVGSTRGNTDITELVGPTIVLEDNYTYLGITYPKKGIYFVAASGYGYTEKFQLNNYNGFPKYELKAGCMPFGGFMLVNFSYTGMEQSAGGMTLTGASADRTYEDVKAFTGNGGMAFGVITVQGDTLYIPLYAVITLNEKKAVEFMIRPIGQYSGTTAEAVIYEDGTVTLALNAS